MDDDKLVRVMSSLEGLTQDDWREFHSDSEVTNIAKDALELLKEPRKDDKISEIKELAIDIGYLYDWYQHSVPDNEWPDKYIEEVFHDFYLIPKQENEIKE